MLHQQLDPLQPSRQHGGDQRRRAAGGGSGCGSGSRRAGRCCSARCSGAAASRWRECIWVYARGERGRQSLQVACVHVGKHAGRACRAECERGRERCAASSKRRRCVWSRAGQSGWHAALLRVPSLQRVASPSMLLQHAAGTAEGLLRGFRSELFAHSLSWARPGALMPMQGFVRLQLQLCVCRSDGASSGASGHGA